MDRVDRRLRLALCVQMGVGGGASESGGAMGSMGGLKIARTNVGRRVLSFCWRDPSSGDDGLLRARWHFQTRARESTVKYNNNTPVFLSPRWTWSKNVVNTGQER